MKRKEEAKGDRQAHPFIRQQNRRYIIENIIDEGIY
jgi:hypothetical protein